MNHNDLLLVLASLVSGAMVIGATRALRTRIAPTGYWTLGWAALIAAGGFTLLNVPALNPLTPALATLLSPLMLAGALQHAGRRVPRWLVPGGVALSIVGLLMRLAGTENLEHAIALMIQPALLLLSAWILRDARPHWSLRPIQIGLIGLAAVSVTDGLADLASPPRGDPLLAWLLVGVPTAALQMIASFDRVRRRAEATEAERRSESERFQALIASLGETTIVLFDLSGNLQQVVSAPVESLRTYGLTGSETTSQHATEILSAKDQRAFLSAIRDIASTGRPQTISLEPSFPAGDFCIELALSPVHDADGDIESLIGVVHDVTRHVQNVRALRKSEQSLNALLATLAANRVVVIDRSGVIQSVVAAVEHQETPYGIHREQIEGIQISDLLPGPVGERVLGTLGEVFDTHRIRDLEECVRLPGGEFHFAVSLRPLLDAKGETENVLAVCTDVSGRVGEEQQREAFEAQVRQAQKLESIGVLAGGIAHDFNNLLTGMLGNIELSLDAAPVDSSLHQYLRDIEHATVQASDLTAQLLAYAGKTAIAPSDIEIGALVKEMEPLLRTGLVGGAELHIRHTGKPAWVQADATQIRQLVMNLVTNALEALPRSGGRVEIATDRVEADIEKGSTETAIGGGCVSIEVRDNGCGMDLETQQRIYEPFFSTKFEGRGLGLAGALGIVRSHDGELKVESKPGAGSVFRVRLPLVEPSALGQAPTERARDASRRRRGTVLVVDDERAVRVVTTRMLEALGYRAICAATGHEALALLAGAPDDFDASLIDLTMPDWPGERAGASLRNVRRDLPIIFMTGHSERDALERTKEFDRTGFLAKPFRRDQLGEALSQLLEVN